ncbi:tetratricopeptide repeat-containing sensor histidine kinase [Winogradskyella vidalii]|uniref:tetratricopeptide repeat-containing sensor histidine kinase n=1 Tax=Winogradskyella vidalii TaxID=2615024 RepID=UPI0015CCDC52|nr:tetratricopeptide repeat-containing sensor histidine kinase [Winogradskyella vidalii]
MRYYLNLLFLIFFGVTFSQHQNLTPLDSIIKLRELSQNEELAKDVRIKYAKRAVSLSNEFNKDTTRLASGRNLGLLYDKLEKIDLWQQQNSKNLLLATKVSDTLALAVANFNIGLAKHFYETQYDSAYYYYKDALKYYIHLGDSEIVGSLYLYIAEIQNTEKVYISSEENAINALKIFNSLPETEASKDDMWIVYNLLGVVSLNLGHYNKSLEYHKKALDVASDMEDGMYNKTVSYNNQAYLYNKLENYEEAIRLYNELIDLRSVYEVYDPTFYPLIIDNLAYTKVLAGHTDFDNIEAMFYEAYDISTNLNDDITKLAITIDLAKYYNHRKINDSTLVYSQKAYKLSKRLSSNEILLESMILLSEIKSGDEGKKYLKEYIKLTDSLLYVERNVRNKFARIELETDQLEAKNKQISKENLYLLILSAGLLLTVILVYVVISQRSKNRKLKLAQVQQRANEDIYNLMLTQQEKIDEARAKEKIRVSKELHDGVLGKLFGVRLSLDSINFKEGKEAILARAKYIDQLQAIEQDIRKISHELNMDFVSGSGYIDILTELIENQSQAYNLGCEFNSSDAINWDLVSNKIKINMYRIIQESMQNIYKHAKANTIKISISLEKDLICLGIIDDGEGFDTSKSKKGIGLKNMTSRVADIYGNISFNSQSNSGTEISVKIPYLNQPT